MELISAMPPAAAAPPSRPVGQVQNSAGDTISPAAATHKAISATSGEGVSADTASATPEGRTRNKDCHSRVSGNPSSSNHVVRNDWMPAFAGMTN